MKIVILSTCDEWKSNSSMENYWMGTFSISGLRRLYKVIRDGIQDKTFTYDSNEFSTEEQLELFDQDEKKYPCIGFWLVIKDKLDYGYIQTYELNNYC